MRARPRRSNVSDGILHQLVARIRDGTLRPGSRLPSERELMQEFGVGRSSVREAVRALAIGGIVESATKRGTTVVSDLGNGLHADLVRTVNYWALADVQELRVAIEGYAAAAAAESATEAEIAAIARAHDRMVARLQTSPTYFDENNQFHLAIALASHNQALVSCLSSILYSFQEDRERIDQLQRVPLEDIRDHAAILEAIGAREATPARELMEQHLRRVITYLEPPDASDADVPSNPSKAGRDGRRS